MPGAPMLEARIDRKTFHAADGQMREVLRGIALSIGPGEVIGLLGASGTGKSTTLRILLGLDTAFAGEVRRGRLRIGVMFQEPRLLPWLTVADNLRLVVTADMPQPDITGLLEMVELPQAAQLYPRQLSLGMARRAALARALAVSPDLLVLDEPFASLDRRLGAGLGEMVARWAQRGGGSVLLATHDLAQAVGLCSRLLILAGAPAALAADICLPAGGDAQAVLTGLVGRFAFLSPAGDERLPSAPQPA